MKKKKISIVTPCFNEEDNVDFLYLKVKEQFDNMPEYEYEHIFIDNDSDDKTVDKLRELARKDNNVKLILNSRNFGPVKSPHYGLLQGSGDATMLVVADLQDPPELIPQFIRKWEEGNDIVIGVKSESDESPIMYMIRKIYYNLTIKLSESKLVKNYYGFGIYDRKIIDTLKRIDDPFPYTRGMIMDLASS